MLESRAETHEAVMSLVFRHGLLRVRLSFTPTPMFPPKFPFLRCKVKTFAISYESIASRYFRT